MYGYLVRDGNTYPNARSCPNGRQHTDIKMNCIGTVVCVLTRTSIKMNFLAYKYKIISGQGIGMFEFPKDDKHI
jgi:hypothetical protein